MRTLVFFGHGVGDSIMFTGVLDAYKQAHPDEDIDLVLLSPQCANVWKGSPSVNKVILYPHRHPRYWNALAFWLIDFWQVRGYLNSLASDYDLILFPKIQLMPELFYYLTSTYGLHKVERMARDVGLPEQTYSYNIATTDKDRSTADNLAKGERIAVFHPYSSDKNKVIDAERQKEIVSSLRKRGYTPYVIGTASEYRSDVGAPGILDAGLGTLVEVLRKAALFVGTDSAIAHIAGFARTRQIMIYSSKLDPEWYRPVSRSQVQIYRSAGSLAARIATL